MNDAGLVPGCVLETIQVHWFSMC